MRHPSLRGIAAAVGSAGLLLASSPSTAADKYAVVSAIGDELTIVTYQPSVGSNIDSNRRQVVPLRDDSFDQVAAKAAEAAIHQVVPDAETVIEPAREKSAFLHDDRGSNQTVLPPEQLARLRKGLKESDARYLVVIAKSRGDTRLQFRNERVGEGKLFGIGFYFDRFTYVTQDDTGNEGQGFLAPYAYLSISLVDLQTGHVIRTKTTNETASIGTGASASETHPWDAVPAATKVDALNNVIRKAVATSVPQVLAPGGL